ncbi:MAG TPA: ABC transporter ATP-binding protein [Acidimicrobiales bacterium]|nr:ABC transporter ATP-binding protein [Acidimicrobiales bacterium]
MSAPSDPPGALDGRGPMLVATGVEKVYRTSALEVHALRGIDLTIGRGEFLAVMGPSGSGKTTLLNCLSGLDEIDAGSVVVDGADIHAMSDARRTAHRARAMGFIFQTFNLIPVLSAVENVELPLLLVGEKAAGARRMAEAMLERVGLADRREHRPTELSGGEQQRVAVARALVTGPSIVWGDEPTGNLDTQMASSVLDLLHEVNRAGQTVVVVTHDPNIGRTAGRLVRMQDGAVVADGPPSDVLEGVAL